MSTRFFTRARVREYSPRVQFSTTRRDALPVPRFLVSFHKLIILIGRSRTNVSVAIYSLARAYEKRGWIWHGCLRTRYHKRYRSIKDRYYVGLESLRIVRNCVPNREIFYLRHTILGIPLKKCPYLGHSLFFGRRKRRSL